MTVPRRVDRPKVGPVKEADLAKPYGEPIMRALLYLALSRGRHKFCPSSDYPARWPTAAPSYT